MTTQVESSTSNTNYLDLIGSKLRHQLGSQINEHINNNKNDNGGSTIPAFAKAQLEKLGWKEGEGLGKRRQGMASHIKVVKRAEGLGLGESTLDRALHQSLVAQDWWKHSVGNTLAKLANNSKNNKKKKDPKDKKKKNKSKHDPPIAEEATTTMSKVYTDEELFQATGGARFGMRAQTRQQAKWKRAESNISAEQEEQAKRNVEWDGMAPPQVLLTLNHPPATPPSKTEEDATTRTERKERKREKREKKEKRRRTEEESMEKVEDDDDVHDAGKKSKQRAKKQKISKNQA